ncbi:MAG: PHP domain-containing protein [Caldilineaceae bacterium]|nr:PHP domain-containing protein [Caldilineaceae bacterium]
MPNTFALDLAHVVNPNPGWYGGDFHAHTHHSDGALTPPELAALARREGMDFLAITDHNSLGAYPHFGTTADLCIIPGVEVTYSAGHYNVFGLTQPAPWQQPVTQGPIVINHVEADIDPDALLAQSAAAGMLNSINHPLLPPWAWLMAETDLRDIHCLEIWNDPSWPDNRVGNPLAVEMWTRWLNAGHRITAIGGSDYHRPVNKPGTIKPPDRLGTPRTYVYANELSGAAILEGLRRRQVYVSMGARVEFNAHHNGADYPIGADLGTQTGSIELTGTIAPLGRSGTARLLHNGKILAEALLYGDAATLYATVELDPSTPAWFRLDVLDGNGLMLAITNPIFAGPVPTPTLNTYGDFVDVTIPSLRS